MKAITHKILWVALLVCCVTWLPGFAQSPAQPPVMQNTGDQEADALQYEQDKDAWIQQHPEMFQTELQPVNSAANPSVGYPAVSGFQATGNPAVDNAAYEQAKNNASLVKEQDIREIEAAFQRNKELWSTSDPARYQAYKQAIQAAQAQLIYIPRSEYDNFPAAKKAVIDANPALYIITH